MRILIVTPAATGSRSGNRVTAKRWARLLRQLQHRVTIATAYERQRPDLLIALHARRSQDSISRWRQQRGSAPLILALTGTDLYGDIHTDAGAQASLQLADRFIVLQEAGITELPAVLQSKARVIVQSVTPPKGVFPIRQGIFEVCVLGHLRDVKDPLRTAAAARLLPTSSQLLVCHAGGAINAAMATRARHEMDTNPRYRWLGELPRWRAMRLLARSRAMILTSTMEGGANVVSEALACGVPVLSSHISGSIGLLGTDYPGYFPVGDTRALADKLERLEAEPSFLAELTRRCHTRADSVQPAAELQRLRQLLAEF